MTLGERLGLSDSRERLLTRALQVGLLATGIYGLVAPAFTVTLHAGIGLAVTALPALLRREYDYAMDPGLVLWIALAMVLNAVGFLGPYRQYAWYDEVTHTISATLLAGIGYAAFRAVEEHSPEVDVPASFRSLFIVVFVLAAAVLWELLEFAAELGSEFLGVSAPLVVFGIYDVVTDMIFNAVGAIAVAIWGTDHFTGLAAFLRDRLNAGDRS